MLAGGVGLGITLFLHLLLTRTAVGSRMLAVSEDATAAELMGIRPQRMQALWLLFDELIQVLIRGQRQKLDKLLFGNDVVEQLSGCVELTCDVLLLSNHPLDLIQFVR